MTMLVPSPRRARRAVPRANGRSRRRADRGASAVEFALVSPLLFTLLFATIDYGLYFADVLTVQQSASDAARDATLSVGSVSANWPGSGSCGAVPIALPGGGTTDLTKVACSLSASVQPLGGGVLAVKAEVVDASGAPSVQWLAGNRLRVCAATTHDAVLPFVPLPGGGLIRTPRRDARPARQRAPPARSRRPASSPPGATGRGAEPSSRPADERGAIAVLVARGHRHRRPAPDGGRRRPRPHPGLSSRSRGAADAGPSPPQPPRPARRAPRTPSPRPRRWSLRTCRPGRRLGRGVGLLRGSRPAARRQRSALGRLHQLRPHPQAGTGDGTAPHRADGVLRRWPAPPPSTRRRRPPRRGATGSPPSSAAAPSACWVLLQRSEYVRVSGGDAATARDHELAGPVVGGERRGGHLRHLLAHLRRLCHSPPRQAARDRPLRRHARTPACHGPRRAASTANPSAPGPDGPCSPGILQSIDGCTSFAQRHLLRHRQPRRHPLDEPHSRRRRRRALLHLQRCAGRERRRCCPVPQRHAAPVRRRRGAAPTS